MGYVRLKIGLYLAIMPGNKIIEIDAATEDEAKRKLQWYTDDEPMLLSKIPGVVNCIGKKDMFGNLI